MSYNNKLVVFNNISLSNQVSCNKFEIVCNKELYFVDTFVGFKTILWRNL